MAEDQRDAEHDSMDVDLGESGNAGGSEERQNGKDLPVQQPDGVAESLSTTSDSYDNESLSVYDTEIFISLLERAFKMIKNGVYFIVIALLIVELFEILIYANEMTCDVTLLTRNDVQSQKMEYL